MIVRGIDIANPALNIGGLLSDQAKALYPQIDEQLPRRPQREPTRSAASRRPTCSAPTRTLDPVIAALERQRPRDAEDPPARC